MKENKDDLKAKIESILFAAGKSVSLQELEKITKAKESKIKEIALELEKDYEHKKSSLRIIIDKDTVKLTVRDQYLPVVENIVTETELPKSVMETLAVIAFKHPILQADLVKIRSNKCYDHLAQLEDAGFIKRERIGRTKKIHLTQKFFDYFELPPNKVKEAFSSFEAVSHAIEEKEKEVEAKLEEYERENKKKIKDAKLKKENEKEENAEMFDGNLEDLDTDFEEDDNISPAKIEVYDANTIPDGDIEIVKAENKTKKKESKEEMLNKEVTGEEDKIIEDEKDELEEYKKKVEKKDNDDDDEDNIFVYEDEFSDESKGNKKNTDSNTSTDDKVVEFKEEDFRVQPTKNNQDSGQTQDSDDELEDEIDYMRDDFDPEVDLKGMPADKKAEIILKRNIEKRANSFININEDENNDDDEDNKTLDNIAKEIQEEKQKLQD